MTPTVYATLWLLVVSHTSRGIQGASARPPHCLRCPPTPRPDCMTPIPVLRLGWQSLPSGKPAMLVPVQPAAQLSRGVACLRASERGAGPEAWASPPGQDPHGSLGAEVAAPSSGAGLSLPPLGAEGPGDTCISRAESLAAVPMSHFIRLGSAPGTGERAEEAGGCWASLGDRAGSDC